MVACPSVTRLGIRRAVFATAGHVDHGKTALVRALTGTDTDRLPEEKRRGISIELGFAELPDDAISFIDVPGHRRLVHAMIAGASGVDAVVLVVAADDGVMPQTREHLHVTRLLGIDRVVVALTKTDLVDAEMCALAEADARELCAEVGLEPISVIATSSTTGAGIDELRRELARVAHGLPLPPSTHSIFLAVDRVFSIRGAGTVVTGTLARGRLEVDRPVYVVGPAGVRESACRALEIHGRAEPFAIAPTRVAVNLSKLDKTAVSRGDVLTADPGLSVSSRLDVALRILPKETVDDGDPVVVHLGTTRASARVVRLGDTVAHLTLETPVACSGGLGFVLRGFAAKRERGAVLGGGRVLDSAPPPLPPRRDKAARTARATMLAFAEAGDIERAARGMLELAAPRPLEPGEVERRLGVEPGSLTEPFAALARAGTLVSIAGGRAFTTEAALERLETDAIDVATVHHRDAPHEFGISSETIRAKLRERSSRDASELALERLLASGRLILVAGGLVCTPDVATKRETDGAAQSEVVLGVLDAARLEGAEEKDLVLRSGLSVETVRTTLARLGRDGVARGLSGLWFSERALDELRRKVGEYFRANGTLTLQALKDLSGVSRKQAIPLIEQLDREGTTRRVGDVRTAGPRGNGP
ncbi:MAG TPA: selenocysteine-specific translation elongation factor [Polyangiaceae bacterium]|nr:selenocysteine-specific translation elongation factor [Polyangiaceae bacterium]